LRSVEFTASTWSWLRVMTIIGTAPASLKTQLLKARGSRLKKNGGGL
jgi:hypothetical protein